MNLLNVRFTERSAKNERDFLEKVVIEDDQSAEAWGRLAGILASDYLNCWNGAEEPELRRAEYAVQKAFALEPKNPMALHANGLIHRARKNHAASRDAFHKARTEDPTIACAYAQEAAQEINTGTWDDRVLNLVLEAISRGPKDPSLGVFHWIIARGYFFAGKYSDAIPYLQQSIQERPHLWYNRLYLVAVYHIMGNVNERNAQLDAFRTEFLGFQIGDVAKNESKSPNDDRFVTAGRDIFRKNVTEAWHQHPK